MKKLSVIIPVYNTEKYIGRCLDSVLSQSYRNTEIICIDDCSKDSSYSICKHYSSLDDRIVLIRNSANRGVSETRNIGLKMASGDCICFIDSDDYILADMFEKMMKYMDDYHCCVCQFAREYSTGIREEYAKYYNEFKDEYESLDFYKLMINSNHYYLDGIVSTPCNKIYKKELFDGIRFFGRYGEDYGVADLLYARQMRIKMLRETFYIYSFQNQKSLTRGQFNIDKYDFLDVLHKRTEIYEKYTDIENKTHKKYCNMFLEYYDQSEKNGMTIPLKYTMWFNEHLKQLKKQKNSMSKKDSIRFALFSIHPLLYKTAMSLRTAINNKPSRFSA